MTITQFIEHAIQGGWDWNTNLELELIGVGDEEAHFKIRGTKKYAALAVSFILLNPEAWKAVGKVQGWSQSHKHYENNVRKHGARYRYEMHRMIDALAEGRSITQFLETL